MREKVQNWLHKQNQAVFSLYAIVASFCTYSCMYAFRKPFAVATFDDLQYWNIDYKILLITAQVAGYTLSKFLGVKLISEMENAKRAFYIITLVGIAGLALLLFAIIPAPYNIVCLFLNGLPLGMIWGLVFSYLEGRKVTEILGAGLSVSFIFSSGFVKSVGKLVMIQWGFSEYWMPLVTGLLFMVPLILFVFMLDLLPNPTAEDIRSRTKGAHGWKGKSKVFHGICSRFGIAHHHLYDAHDFQGLQRQLCCGDMDQSGIRRFSGDIHHYRDPGCIGSVDHHRQSHDHQAE